MKIEREDFIGWLQKERGLSIRSSRDVLSRLKRVDSIIDLSKESSADQLIKKISSNPDFNKLSISVKSQLKRAIILFKNYR